MTTGLHVDVLRGRYASRNLPSSKVDTLTVVGLGPFEVTDNAPAYRLESHVRGCARLVPVEQPAGMVGPMFGGNYAATSDGRLAAEIERLTGQRFYGAVAIHDLFETIKDYNDLSR